MKFTFLFLNLGKIQIFIPKSTEEGGSAGLGIVPKKTVSFSASLIVIIKMMCINACSRLRWCVLMQALTQQDQQLIAGPQIISRSG